MERRKNVNYFNGQKLINWLWEHLSSGHLRHALYQILDPMFRMGVSEKTLTDHEFMVNVLLPKTSTIKLQHHWNLIADFYYNTDAICELPVPTPYILRQNEHERAIYINSTIDKILAYATDVCADFLKRKIANKSKEVVKQIDAFYLENKDNEPFNTGGVKNV